MTWHRELGSRVHALFGARRMNRDLDEELRSHIEMETEANRRRGMAPEEARSAALREFGSVTQTAEAYRERRGLPLIETLFQDLRYALRGFRKSPGFTAVAILSLALGMGVNTAIFSVVNMLLLRPMAVEDPGQLVTLSLQQKDGFAMQLFSYPDYRDIREQTAGALSDILAYLTKLDGLSIDDRADRIITHYVTGNYFTLLGVKPALGRLILPSEGKVDGYDPVLVLGYSYWQTRFAGNPDVIGKRVRVDGHPVTIVGIAPEQFHGAKALLDVQGYLPLGMSSISNGFVSGAEKNRSARTLYVLGRMAKGVTLNQAEARLKVVSERLAALYPKDLSGVTIHAQGEALGRISNGEAVVAASVLFLGMAALVLVLACVNLANLLMVRATARQKEVALRAALGGSRSRLIRQLLTESFLLTFLGAVAGLLLGAWTCRALTTLKLQGVPIFLDFSFDARVFAYAFAAAAVTGLMLGIFPALHGSRADLATVSREGGVRISGNRQRVRSGLVMAQVAASFVLLVVAALLTRSLQNAKRLDLGYDTRNVVNFGLDPRHVGYDATQGRQFYKELLRRVRALPGVESASLALCGPMSAYPLPAQVQIEGYTPPRGQSGPTVYYDIVSFDLFQTLRMPVVRGRDFAETDDQKAPQVAIINQTMADRYWPGQDPIGKKLQWTVDPGHWIQVIGVLRDSRYLALTDPRQPYFYLPAEQNYASIETLRVKSSSAPETVMAEVRKEIADLAPGLPVAGVETMLQQLDSSTGFLRYRLEAGFAAALGVLGLALALLGLYGVVSFNAAQRTREIGIRMALGAQTNDVRKMVLGRGLIIVCAGLAAGVVLSLGAAPIVRQFVLDVSATDPLTFAGVATLLAIVTLVACYIPARRAMRVDPMVVLRIE